ncbi:MAG: fumarylacetoacetate hydrolase family protein, partial [Alphaproteobacteria bacterium]|nr:fumarylacetoacetate hydrolase family protein [Alphaproteobacteria bacterium]
AREEVLDAIDAVMPAIEIVDSRYKDFQKMDRLAQLADNQSNGALVVGPPLKDWRSLKLDALKAKLSVDGKPLVETVGGNTAGDPVRPLTWLPGVLGPRRHRIEAGTIVTTGALTGLRFVDKPCAVKGEIEGLGTVELVFSS